MNDRAAVIGIINGTNTLFNAIIRTLDKRGLLDRETFRSVLLESTKQSRAEAGPRSDNRLDFVMFENLAKLLTDDEAPMPWRPVVIQGGKSD